MKKKNNPFIPAISGFRWFYQSQWNAKVHTFASIVAIFAGWILNISRFEWLLIILVIGMVYCAELLNTAIEFLLDKLHPEFNDQIGKAKDIAAAAVLLASFIALVIGIGVFAPYIAEIIGIT